MCIKEVEIIYADSFYGAFGEITDENRILKVLPNGMGITKWKLLVTALTLKTTISKISISRTISRFMVTLMLEDATTNFGSAS